MDWWGANTRQSSGQGRRTSRRMTAKAIRELAGLGARRRNDDRSDDRNRLCRAGSGCYGHRCCVLQADLAMNRGTLGRLVGVLRRRGGFLSRRAELETRQGFGRCGCGKQRRRKQGVQDKGIGGHQCRPAPDPSIAPCDEHSPHPRNPASMLERRKEGGKKADLRSILTPMCPLCFVERSAFCG
jgi:hypothetical protein